MSLDESFYELVGAGLVACAAGLGLSIPSGAVVSGDAFVGFLSQRGEWGETNRIVEELKRVSSVAPSTIPLASSIGPDPRVMHARALCLALEKCRPDPALLRDALQVSGVSTAAREPIGRRLAAGVVAKAAQSGLMRPPLNEDLAFELLELVLTRLLARPAFIIGLHGAFADYITSAFPDGAGGDQPRTVQEQHASGSTQSRAAAVRGVENARSNSSDAAQAGARADVVQPASSTLADPARARLEQILRAQGCTPDGLVIRLEELSARLGEIIASLTKATNDDAETRRCKAEAARALAAGEFERAIDFLGKARRLVREGRRRIEQRLREDIEQLGVQMAAEANAIETLADMEFARGDFEKAADLYAEARDSLPLGEDARSRQFVLREAACLLWHGRATRDVEVLQRAVTRFSSLDNGAAGEQSSPHVAEAHAGAAAAHAHIWQASADTTDLQAAISSWQKAAAVYGALDDAPMAANASFELGQLLVAAGESERSSGWFTKASEAFRSAATMLPRERDPQSWADTQRGLGQALVSLAELGAQPQADYFENALVAFRRALTVYTATAQRNRWAETQIGCGHALAGLADCERSVAKLGDAVLAYHEASQVLDADRDRKSFVAARLGLADAYAAIGQSQGDSDRLQAAAAGYNAVLPLISRTDDPIQWATVNMNRGNVLLHLGEMMGGVDLWAMALQSLTDALEEFEAHGEEALAHSVRRSVRNLHQAMQNVAKKHGKTG